MLILYKYTTRYSYTSVKTKKVDMSKIYIFNYLSLNEVSGIISKTKM